MPSQLEQLVDAVIETDFLVVGGGLAGCLAALQAKRKNKILILLLWKNQQSSMLVAQLVSRISI